jgi:CubicO group peptidase (beta-lactamase class C family)
VAHPAGKPDWAAAEAKAAELVAPWSAEQGAPGGAILAFDANNIPVAVAAGLESLATGAAFSADSVVRYASVTKHVLAAMQRRHRDRVALSHPLSRHLPELRGPMAEVSVGRGLDMTGGLPDVRETLSLLGLSVHTATEAAPLLDFIASLGALNFPAGREISYSNTGYRLVEIALARQGILFNDWVQAEIGAPLGIAWRAPETWFDPIPGLVPGYWKGATGWQLGNAGLHLSASGSLTGSGRALAIWGQAVLANRGPAAGLLAEQAAPRHLMDGRATAYGLGLAHGRLGPVALVGHGGSHAGYKTYLLLAPEPGLGIVVVANREDTGAYGLALRAMAALLGQEVPPAASLPEGLYAEPGTGHWLEVTGNTASFLGASEALYQGEDGWAVSLSAHNPMRLRAEDGGIEGEIGHVARHFRPVAAEPVPAAAQGHWRSPAYHAGFDIEGETLASGIGPARMATQLRPLGEGRLLATLPDGPWNKQFSLRFEKDEVALVSHRSRVLRFRRG